MKISYGTDIGVVRNDNQDSVYAQEYSAKCGLFIVADGMGGYRGGKIASSTAIEIVSGYFKDNNDNNMNSKEIQKLILLFCQTLHFFVILRQICRINNAKNTFLILL